jgi:hypothetical protein
VSDYFNRRDIQGVSSFDDPNALFDFKFEAPQQVIQNESTVAIELSWDGIFVHARLPPTGPSSVIAWSDHSRAKCYIRRESGVGGGAKMVTVMAATR